MKKFLLIERINPDTVTKIFGIFLLLFVSTSFVTGQDVSFAISKSGPQTAGPGELITYTITYSNTGQAQAKNVIIKDYLPDAANYTFVESVPAATVQGNQLTWNIGNLGSGTNQIIVKIRAGKPGTESDQSPLGYYTTEPIVNLENKAGIQSDEVTTPVESNTVITTVNQVCTFVLNEPSAGIKSATGSTLTYLMALTNTGNIYQKFNLESAYLGGPNTLSRSILSIDGQEISSTPFLAPGETYVFHYKLKIITGTAPNQYYYSSVTANPLFCGNPLTNQIDTEIYGGKYSNYDLLGVYKVDNPDPVKAGEILTYQIIVFYSDKPGETLSDVKVTETYPANTTFVSAFPEPETGSNNIWNLPVVNAGNNVITVQLQVDNDIPDRTILSNTVSIGSPEVEELDSFTEYTTVNSSPNLSITKTATVVNSPAGPGSLVNYTLTYENIGNRTAPFVEILDNYDVAYMEVENTSGGNSSVPGEIKWEISSLAPGAGGTINYTLKIKDNPLLFSAGSTSINNEVVISSGLPEENINNNSDNATVSVSVLPDLFVTKTATPEDAEAGEALKYTVTYGNMGEVAHSGQNFVVKDYLPAGTTLQNPGSLPNGGVYNSGEHSIEWTFTDPLNPGAENEVSMEITLEAIDCNLVGSQLENKVTIWSTYYNDADNSNNEFTLLTDVEDNTLPVISGCPADTTVYSEDENPLSCAQEVSWIEPTASDNCELTNFTSNMNPGDEFPLGKTTVTYIATDASGNSSTCSFKVIVIDNTSPSITTCPENQTVDANSGTSYEHSGDGWNATATDNCSVTLSASLTGATTASDLSTLDNVSFNEGITTVTWTATDGADNSDECSFTVTVNAFADLEIEKTVESSVIEAGGEVEYKILVTNNGPAAAINVQITDDVSSIFTDTPQFSTDGINYSDWTGSYSLLNNLANGADFTIYIKGTLSENQCSNIENTASVSSDNDNDNGNNSSTTSDPIEDNIPPVIKVPIDELTMECLDPDVVDAWTATASATDNCDVSVTVSASYNAPANNCSQTVTVTFTATDESENSTTATKTFTVNDTTEPVVTAPAADLELECDQSADYSTLINDWLATASAADNCDGTVSVSNDFDVNDLSVACGSELTVTFSATDACENTGTATAKIKVTDTTAPLIVLPTEDLILECYNSDAVDAWIATAMATDNCDGETDVTASYDVPDSNCEQTVTVTFSATDNCGNTAAAAKTFTVDDKTGPEFSEIIPFNSECSSETLTSDIQAWIESVNAVDNCGEVTVSNDFDVETLSVSGCGELTVTFTAEDECGNSSVVASTIVIEDTTPPVVECNPITINLRNNGIYILSQGDIRNLAGSVSDNCSSNENIEITVSRRSFSCDNAGQAVPVTITATDECGNSTECQTTVTVRDNMAPQITCPEDITVSTDAETCGAIVDFEALVAENCDYTLVYSHEPGNEFPVGTTEVTVTATDASGNANSCAFTITVVDDVAPVVECPQDIVVRLEEGASTAVVEFTAVASDNCDFTVTYSHESGSEFPLGTTNIVVTATDMAGNSTECSFDINVLDENAPVLICPDDITVSQDEGQCGAVVNFEAGISDESDVTIEYSHEPGSLFPVGTTTVTVTATDDSGNSAECSFDVTVSDEEVPFIACPEDLVVIAEVGECDASVIVPEITELGDNCEFTYTNDFNNSTDASGVYPVGVTEVVWTITDEAGNTANCTMTVTVQSAPVAVDDEASTQENVPVEIDVLANDTDCTESIDPATVTISAEPANGTVSVDSETGMVIYSPASGFSGTDEFTYSVCNADGLCGEATVTITVIEVNVNTTVAEDDEFIMVQDTTLEADVSVNDYDPEGDNQINFSVLVPPANGTFALFPDGTFEFTPYEGFIGEDYFIYEVCDDGEPVACATATAYILVEEREADTIIVEPPFQVAFKIPEGFSPNYDGYNDYFVIQHLHEAYPNAKPKLEVYNRWGTLLYQKEDYGNTDRWGTADAWWDGSSNKKFTMGNEKLPPGTYFYILYFNDGSEPIKGSVFLNRNR